MFRHLVRGRNLMLRKRFSQPACVCSGELIYKHICSRFAAPHPVSPGAALEARTRLCLAELGLFIASGREPGRSGDRTSSLRPVLEPFPFPPQSHCHPRGLPSPSSAPDSGQSPPVVWGWRRRNGQGAPRARILLRPALTLGEEDGGERGSHLCPAGREGLKLPIFNSSRDPRF